jgi:hypothetical protein
VEQPLPAVIMPAGGAAYEKMYCPTFAARSQFTIIFDMIDFIFANG